MTQDQLKALRRNGKMAVNPKPVLQIAERERGVYATAQQKFAGSGQITTPGFLRMEQRIIKGKTKYIFKVTRDSNSDSETEQKLEINDKFMASQIGLFLIHRDENIVGAEVLCTFPDPTVFPVISGVSNPAHLEAIYNGKFSVVVGQTKYLEALDVRRFRCVPNQQAVVEVLSNDTPPVKLIPAMLSEQHENSGFINLTPQIIFDGSAKNEIAIEIPVNANHEIITNVANHNYYMVMIMRGFLGTNR